MRPRGASLDDLQRVYELRLPELRRVAAAIVGDRDLACDVVQDAFVNAVRQRGSYSGTGPVEGWIWRIVVNAARDARAARRSHEEPDVESGAVGVDAVDIGRRQMVRRAVERLPERQRLVLFLRAYADLSHGAIADALGISDGTVAATLNAAHGRLRALLAEVRG